MVQIVDLESKAALPILTDLRAAQVTLLVGSAISLWAPSNLPTGQEFTDAAFRFLFDGCALTDLERRTIFNRVYNLPFEHLMGLCPSQTKARTLVNDLFGCGKPNKVHRMIARAIGRN